jgi:hypothetical protein
MTIRERHCTGKGVGPFAVMEKHAHAEKQKAKYNGVRYVLFVVTCTLHSYTSTNKILASIA